jgi:ankyrin repeat protein
VDQIVIAAPIETLDLSLMAAPFRQGPFYLPGILSYDAPMFFVAIFLADMEWILNLFQAIQADLDSLFRLRDAVGRGPAHFAAARGRFQELLEAATMLNRARELTTNAVQADGQGLLPIHYAACAGSIRDVKCFSRFQPGYDAVTEDENRYNLLDLALESSRFALAKWLLSETSVNWRESSPAAFYCVSGGILEPNTPYSEIMQLLDHAGYDLTYNRNGKSLLLRASNRGDLHVVHALLPYQDRLPFPLQFDACEEACRSGQVHMVKEFLTNWSVDVNAANELGHSLLWTAVSESRTSVVRLLLKLGADPGGMRDPLSSRRLASELANEDVLDAFEKFGSTIEDLPIQLVCLPSQLYCSVGTQLTRERMIERGKNMRSILASQNLYGRNTTQLTVEDLFLFLCANPNLDGIQRPRSRGQGELRGSMVIQCRTCGEGKGCKFKIRWTTAGAPFSLDAHRLCLCCLSARSAIPPRPCQKFDVFLVATDRLDSILPASHPARELSRYLVGHCPNLNLSALEFLKALNSPRTQLRSQVEAVHSQSLEALIDSLMGSVFLQTADGDSPSKYPLFCYGSEVVTLTWVAPWTQNLLQCGAIQYVELDASFYALRPYIFIVPLAIIANYAIPMGLIMAPTEREESYRLFDEAMTSIHLGPGLVHDWPILSDEGQALNAYCRGHEDQHYFCFRHRLELLGSNTYVAMLARRLFFVASEDGYREMKTVTITDFRIGCQEGAINSNGARLFCEFFGLSLHGDDLTIEVDDIDPFVTQALWSQRGSRGVGTCTNHSEGTHGRANRKVAGVRSLIRRIEIVISMLKKKHDQFSTPAVNRSPKSLLRELVNWAKKHQQSDSRSVLDQCPMHCGWDAIYACRFALPGFPCRHTALARQNSVDWERSGTSFGLGQFRPSRQISCRVYRGRDWPLAKPRGGGHRIPLSDSDEHVNGDADVVAFLARVKQEVQAMFPRVQVMSRELLCIEFGKFLGKRRADDLEVRARFQLQTFRQYSRQ